MYISNIKLWNFRKFGSRKKLDISKPNLDLNFTNGLNVLIGQNDSGKTAIIDSIKLVLKTHSYDWIKVNHEDFHNDSDRFRIEIIIEDFTDHEAKNFTEWLGWKGNDKDIKPFLRLIYDVSRNLEDKYIYPADVKSGVDESGYQLTAEAREYLKITYLKPLRDAKSELIPRKNSRLAQILQGHEAFKGHDKSHILVDHFKEFNTTIENYFKGIDKDENPLNGEGALKGKELKEEIDKYIKAFYSDSKESNFSVNGGNIKNILEKLELAIKGEPNLGLGSLNRLCMASELLHLQKKNWNGIRLGLIEELEAHLHPQAQMQVVESLQEQNDIQLILTTHSPNLASKIKLENLIICNENNAFPMGNSYTKFKADNYIFLEKFLDVTKANLFFAKGVILVEGWAEEILVPSLAKRIGYDLTAKGVSVINIGNVGFDNYSKIFLRQDDPRMTIPVAVVTDCDIREYTAKSYKETDDIGKEIKKTVVNKRESAVFKQETSQQVSKIEAKSEYNVKYFVAPLWTLEYSLFKSSVVSGDFQEITKSIHSKTKWSEGFEKILARKLIDKTLKKTEIAYRLANKFEESIGEDFDQNEVNIKYLVDAIKYACHE